MPALGTLYYALADLWNLANALQVVGTITAIDVFLGLLLGLSSRMYNQSDAPYDGVIDVVTAEDESKMFSLELNTDPYELEKKKNVTFKVNPR